jgi:hypothetical protein
VQTVSFQVIDDSLVVLTAFIVRPLAPRVDPDQHIISVAPGSNDETTRRAADWFQCHYLDLQSEFDAEQDGWTEEMDFLHSSIPHSNTQPGAQP